MQEAKGNPMSIGSESGDMSAKEELDAPTYHVGYHVFLRKAGIPSRRSVTTAVC